MQKVSGFLRIRESFGFFELLYALLPILAGYILGGISFTLILSVLFSVMAFIKTHRVWVYKPYLFLIGYIILHELILCITMSVLLKHHVNLMITLIAVLISPIFIIPALKFEKLCKPLFLVALISGIGLVYHYIMIKTGSVVMPIKLPFLPIEAEHTRLMDEINRPCSFFVEPAAFATFMMVPLFLSLRKNLYLYTILILIVLFLSTSTTAVVESVVVIVVYVFTSASRRNMFRAIFLSLLFVGLGFFVLNSSIFDATFQKIDDTEVNENARLVNGPVVASTLPIENFPFGINYANISDYVMDNGLASFVIYEKSYGVYLFVPTFWQILIKYGLIGLSLYLFLFYSLSQREKSLIPYISCLVVGWFFQGIAVGVMFTWQLCMIASYIYKEDEITYEFLKVVKESKKELIID